MLPRNNIFTGYGGLFLGRTYYGGHRTNTQTHNINRRVRDRSHFFHYRTITEAIETFEKRQIFSLKKVRYKKLPVLMSAVISSLATYVIAVTQLKQTEISLSHNPTSNFNIIIKSSLCCRFHRFSSFLYLASSFLEYASNL